MKRLWLAFGLAVVLAPGLVAQEPMRPPPPDTAAAERLRAQIEQRFAERVKADLGLTDDQAGKLRATQERFGQRRRALMRQQFERRRALQGQMQPGVAANADSVRKLMDGMQAGRAELLRIEQDEDREMAGYLTPVQRARYQMMRQRFVERVNEMREGRGGGRRDRMRPGAPPGPQQRPRRRPI